MAEHEHESPPPGVVRGREFCTTHWSMVLKAGADGAERTEVRAALETLCRTYWYPLYAFLRRTGHSSHDAQDLTQEYLSRLIEKRYLEGVEPGLGRFRSYLLVTLKHFLSDERKRARALKRGGGVPTISIDEEMAEARYRIEPVDPSTPESLFERAWGNAVLARVMERLRGKYAGSGRAELFDALQPLLTGSGPAVAYVELAARVGLSEGALKVAVHRFRKEFGRLLREEIASTVSDPGEIDAEIRRLIEVTGPTGGGADFR